MKVCVIGGGASGLMAAHIASKNGNNVTLLEKMPRVGKKILATGGGKCNLSNVDMSLSHYHGGDNSFVESIFKQASPDMTLKEFENIGLLTTVRNGGIYPYNELASSVVDVLRNAIDKDGVKLFTECDVSSIKKDGSGKFVVTTSNSKLIFDKVILAAGSKAFSKSGSDGSGYLLAKELGHEIKKPLPALCAVKCKGDYFKSLAGIRCKGRISIFYENNFVVSSQGELQLTNYGVSGIPTMQVSYAVAKGLNENRKVKAYISFLPEHDMGSVVEMIKKRISLNPMYSVQALFTGVFHKNIILLVAKKCGVLPTKIAKDLSKGEIDRLAKMVTEFELEITGTNSFDESQVCQGGIELSNVRNTLESKIINGLYFAGEILDVHADCGGYNLQWAWSTGMVAGSLK